MNSHFILLLCSDQIVRCVHKTKVYLKYTLKAQLSNKYAERDVEAIFLDGCAMLQVIPWHMSGTRQVILTDSVKALSLVGISKLCICQLQFRKNVPPLVKMLCNTLFPKICIEGNLCSLILHLSFCFLCQNDVRIFVVSRLLMSNILFVDKKLVSFSK